MLGASLLAAVLAVCGVAASFFGIGEVLFLVVAGVMHLAGVQAEAYDDEPDWRTAIVIGSIVAVDVGACVAFSNFWIARALQLAPSIAVGAVAGVAAGAVAVRQFRTGFAGMPGTWLTVPTAFVAALVAGVATLISTAL